jgi:hypothetical protein
MCRLLVTAMLQVALFGSICKTTCSFTSHPFLWDTMAELHNGTALSPKKTYPNPNPNPSPNLNPNPNPNPYPNSNPNRLRHSKNTTLRSKPFGSELLGQPLYVSLTTIHSRIYGIAATIESIIR